MQIMASYEILECQRLCSLGAKQRTTPTHSNQTSEGKKNFVFENVHLLPQFTLRLGLIHRYGRFNADL